MQEGFFGWFFFFTFLPKTYGQWVWGSLISQLMFSSLQMLHNIHGQHWLCIVSEK